MGRSGRHGRRWGDAGAAQFKVGEAGEARVARVISVLDSDLHRDSVHVRAIQRAHQIPLIEIIVSVVESENTARARDADVAGGVGIAITGGGGEDAVKVDAV